MQSGFSAPPVGALDAVLDQLPGRALSAQPYWLRLQPHLRSFGITRLADITGLDRLGLSVVQAVRPLARSNAVTQGKAVDLAGAAVGAVLECLEMAAGEDPSRLPTAPSGTPDLWAELAPGLPAGTCWPDAATRYIWAWDLVKGGAVALPADLISTDFTTTAPAGDAPILRQSIGLGAGQSLDAALMHGLLECIEADARLRAETSGEQVRIRLDGADPTYGPALGHAHRAGLRIAVYGLPCAAPVTTVMASVMEHPGAAALPLPAVGYGARFSASAAIAAAVTEALQARLAVISGAREDITQRFYRHQIPVADLDRAWHDHGDQAPDIVPPRDTLHSDTPAPNAAPLSVRGLASHVGPVYGVPLHWDPDLPLAITRIIAPRLIADPLRLGLT